MKPRLVQELEQAKLPAAHVPILAQLVTNWMMNRRLPATLTLDAEATERDYAMVASLTADHNMRRQSPGVRRTTNHAGETGCAASRAPAMLSTMTTGDKMLYSVACIGLYAAAFLFCGVYVLSHHPEVSPTCGNW